MLVVSRKAQQTIHVGQDVTITIVRVKGRQVQIGIEAPRDVRVLRGEVAQADAREAQSAPGSANAADRRHASAADRRHKGPQPAGGGPLAGHLARSLHGSARHSGGPTTAADERRGGVQAGTCCALL